MKKTPAPLPLFLPYLISCPLCILTQPPPICSHFHEAILSHIETPYDPAAFTFFLEKHDLISKYPFLVRNLCNGFPMEEFPHLTSSVIFKNHPSFSVYKLVICEYLESEVVAHRMSGPLVYEEMFDLMKGPFQSLPLIVDVQVQPGKAPDKLRICRHLSKHDKWHLSTNNYIDTDKFPTHFGSASKVANLVSPSLSICTVVPHLYPTHPVSHSFHPYTCLHLYAYSNHPRQCCLALLSLFPHRPSFIPISSCWLS